PPTRDEDAATISPPQLAQRTAAGFAPPAALRRSSLVIDRCQLGGRPGHASASIGLPASILKKCRRLVRWSGAVVSARRPVIRLSSMPCPRPHGPRAARFC